MDFAEMPIAWPARGKYIVAISGGGDSAALLDLLTAHSRAGQWELTAAHFNHGWPGDDAYEETARAAIGRYDVPLQVGRGKVKRTEAAARTARYAFLRKAMKEVGADAIITAHHQDDLEETVILNLLRGTGRHGLAPFARTPDVLRPLVGVRKAELKAYATEKQLVWCHDTYNDDLKFRRNYVRHTVMPRLEASDESFHEVMAKTAGEAGSLNTAVDVTLAMLFTSSAHAATAKLSILRRLDLDIATELLLAMARAARPGVELSRRSVEQLAVDIKTGRLRRRRRLANSLFTEGSRDTVTIVFTP